ncbi:uncharacterized protein YjbK [Cytobacillus horneckiae]|uniref:CYTH domain-containing protein n=1 Tax=Cytobacillus horneckiae TaxID=549687 RepID=UPI0019D2D6A2|nr:CYTH domain-containing protein [Cytobacillus horneckiae]MBN6887526.1 CYTH domain-containing protein [Cytobacillus horneckiae]
MPQNIEIEFKNMLTKEEYFLVKDYFHFKEEHFFTQENYYFDTPSFSLKKLKSALRIREKNGKFELTLKQPYHDGLLETNEVISDKEAEELFHGSALQNINIIQLIKGMGINPLEIKYFGALQTTRAETDFKNGLIVLDHSCYLNKEDFELEYEVTDRKKGSISFENLLNELHIPIRKTDNKIMRFYKEKYRLLND